MTEASPESLEAGQGSRGKSVSFAPLEPQKDADIQPLPGLLRSQRYAQCRTHLHAKQDVIRDYRQTDQTWRMLDWVQSMEEYKGPWINSAQAKILFYFTVALNVTLFVTIATVHDQTDWHSGKVSPAVQWGYFCSELLFLGIFTGELLLRLRAFAQTQGGEEGVDGFMQKGWNRYDMVLLVVAFADVCVLNFIPDAQAFHRMILLLMPACQLLRLGRVVVELRMIIMGILSAMRAVLWAMLLLFLVIYFFAVLSVTYMGSGQSLQEDSVRLDLFGTMPEAMFTLFTFATLEDYTSAVRHFLRSDASGAFVAICIVAFILFANLALLNLVTAVMVDSIIDILPKKRTEKLVQERAALVRRLEALFCKIDEDGNRTLTLEEFRRAAETNEDVRSELGRLQIASLDIKELFTLIDFNDNGVVSVDEFIEGLLRMTPGSASKKELLGVQYDMHKMWNMLGSGQERIMACLGEELAGRIAALERQMEAASEASMLSSQRLEQMLESRFDATCMTVQDNRAAVLKSLEASGLGMLSGRIEELERSLAALPSIFMEKCTKELEGQQRLWDGQQVLLQMMDELRRATTKSPSSSPRHQMMTARFDELRQELQEQRHQQQQIIAAVSREPSPATPTSRGVPERQHSGYPEEVPAEPQASTGAQQVAAPCSSPSTIPAWSASTSLQATPRPGAQQMEKSMSLASGKRLNVRSLKSELEAVLQAPSATPAAQEPSTADAGAAERSLRHPMELTTPRTERRFRETRLDGADGNLDVPDSLSSDAALEKSPAGPPADHGNIQARVTAVLHWVKKQKWTTLPFDKLVLNLDMVGIQLSVAEQDLLKRCLWHPTSPRS
eukprot:TRINITY_DN26727_c0_g1_i1.p1 TRINITY_DN26727_c0_g1~~TRINITY_DN26727_c0_g1_i1.p1  ORF type:complete len:855 (+),score=186.02 TRINITY_DN26727_c0_g1_i1:39-2567(+)